MSDWSNLWKQQVDKAGLNAYMQRKQRKPEPPQNSFGWAILLLLIVVVFVALYTQGVIH